MKTAADNRFLIHIQNSADYCTQRPSAKSFKKQPRRWEVGYNLAWMADRLHGLEFSSYDWIHGQRETALYLLKYYDSSRKNNRAYKSWRQEF